MLAAGLVAPAGAWAAQPRAVLFSGVIESPAGLPQPGAFVGLGTVRAQTDAHGRYALSVVPSKSVAGFIWGLGDLLQNFTYDLGRLPAGATQATIPPIRLASVFRPTYPATLNGLPLRSAAGFRRVHISGWSKYPLEGSIYVMRPSGWVRAYKLRAGGRNYRASFPLGPNGQYRVEIVAWNGMQLFDIPLFHGVSPTPPVGPTLPPPPVSQSPSIQAEFAHGLLNTLRAHRGLPGIRSFDALWRAALAHARDMARYGYYFTHPHSGSDGSSLLQRIRRAGGGCDRAAENVSIGKTVDDAFAALVESPAHLQVFEDRFAGVGVGAARWNGQWLLVMDFCQ